MPNRGFHAKSVGGVLVNLVSGFSWHQ